MKEVVHMEKKINEWNRLQRIKARKEEIMEFLNGKTKEELIEYAYKQQIIIDQLRGEEDDILH